MSGIIDNTCNYQKMLDEYNTNFGFLHLIVGPMFSGKSTKLLNILEELRE